MNSFLVAAAASILVTGVLVLASCQRPGDSCYLMQGASPYIAGGLLIVLWPLVYGAMVIVRSWKQPPPPGGET